MAGAKPKNDFLTSFKGWVRSKSPSGRNRQPAQPTPGISPGPSTSTPNVISADTLLLLGPGPTSQESRSAPNIKISGTTQHKRTRTPTQASNASALSAAPTAAPIPPKPDPTDESPDSALKNAAERFTKELSNEDKAAIQSTEDILDRLRAVGRSHAQSGLQSPPVDRVKRVLERIKTFLGAVGPSFQFCPQAALVVGGINVVLSLVLGYMDFFEKVTDMMERIGEHLEYLSDYGLPTFQDSPQVQKALMGAYCDLLEFFVAVKGVFTDKEGRASYLQSPTLFLKLTWEPFESKFKPIEDKFTHHALIVSRSAAVQALIKENERRAQEDLQRKAERRRKVLQWLSPIEFKQTHERHFKKHFDNTGQWLLDSPLFTTWRDSLDPSLLWCHGLPGTGKTVLASLVLERFLSLSRSSKDTGVSFIYCDYNYKDPRQATIYIKAALKELCQRMDELPDELVRLYDNGTEHPTYKELQCVFMQATCRFGKVFLVLDALDECIEQRPELIGFLRGIVSPTKADSGVVKLFVTSRREPDIQREFASFPVVEIQARKVDADIELYVTAQLGRLIQSGDLDIRDPSLKDEIHRELVGKAGGMFLWVEFQLQHICSQTSDSGIRDALRTLPETMEQTYNEIIGRIHRKPKAQQELARRVLMWMAHVERPLKLQELICAVAMRADTQSRKALGDNLPSTKATLDACANLIVLQDPAKHLESKVRFVHFSVQEFLLQNFADQKSLSKVALDSELKPAHEEISWLCMVFLLHCGTEVGSRINYPPFAKYASESWMVHTRALVEIRPEFERLIIRFFEARAFTECFGYSPGRRAEPRTYWYHFHSKTNFSPPIIASIFGLPLLFEKLELQYQHMDYPDDLYAMHYAARNNSRIAAERLYNLNPRVDQLDPYGYEPLMRAAGVEVAQFFLDKGADVNARGPRCTALHTAAESGNHKMIRFLLHNGADVNLTGTQQTFGPVHIAASHGHKGSVRLLLNWGADVYGRCGGKGALEMAVCGGDKVVLQLFEDQGLYLGDYKGVFGAMLRRVAGSGHGEMVRILLERGADVNDSDSEDGSALISAVRSNIIAVAQLLLDQGANIDLPAKRHGTGLIIAVEQGETDMVQLLLDRGANINLDVEGYGTALIVAVMAGKIDIVQLLLDRGADTNLLTQGQGTPP